VAVGAGFLLYKGYSRKKRAAPPPPRNGEDRADNGPKGESPMGGTGRGAGQQQGALRQPRRRGLLIGCTYTLNASAVARRVVLKATTEDVKVLREVVTRPPVDYPRSELK
jgi:hypothetical protein